MSPSQSPASAAPHRAMKIDSLLNEGPVGRFPVSSSPAAATFSLVATVSGSKSCGTVAARPRPSSATTTAQTSYHNSTTVTPPKASPAATPQPFSREFHRPPNPFPDPVSTRHPYRIPSLAAAASNTAAVSPMESSTPPNSDTTNPMFPDKRTSQMLPSVSSFPPTPTQLVDGPLSPRSTIAHQHHRPRQGSETGYFPPLGLFSPSQQYQLSGHPQHPYSQQAPRYDNSNPLLSLAQFAVDDATPGGRQNLEMEIAAAGSLAGRGTEAGRGSDVAFELPNQRRGADRSRGSHIPDASRSDQMFPPALDPALLRHERRRDATAPSGRKGKSYDAAPTAPDASNSGAKFTLTADLGEPLFRPIPEPSTTPRAGEDGDTMAAGPGNASGQPSPCTSPKEFLNHPPKCSYCSACTTGSPLRKVVSHIFGRNKLSTRQIPKNVWVYYCRKHYQRSRYRNPRGFARQQVHLVRRQCERLELWGGVKDWVIKVRRREEIRMNRQGDDGGEADDGDDDIEDGTGGDDEMEDPQSGQNSRRNSATARRRSSGLCGTNWITAYTGPDKSIEDVHHLLDSIDKEVASNGGRFPDVELLPNVDLSLAVSLDDSNKRNADQDEGHRRRPSDDSTNDQGHGDDDNQSGGKGTKRPWSDNASSGGTSPRMAKKSRPSTDKGSQKGKAVAVGTTDDEDPEAFYSIPSGTHGNRDRYAGSFSSVSTMDDEMECASRARRTQTLTPPPSGSAPSTRRGSVSLEDILSSSPSSKRNTNESYHWGNRAMESSPEHIAALSPRHFRRISPPSHGCYPGDREGHQNAENHSFHQFGLKGESATACTTEGQANGVGRTVMPPKNSLFDCMNVARA